MKTLAKCHKFNFSVCAPTSADETGSEKNEDL